MAKTTLIDLSPLKAGGGCQLALNFIQTIYNNNLGSGLIFLIPNVGPLCNLQTQFPELHFIVSPTKSFLTRFVFEYYTLKSILNRFQISQVYTFFGAGLPKIKGIRSIVSVAYPIICYPESPYWTHINKKIKIRQKIVNALRVKRLMKADQIIVETPVMHIRLAQVLKKSASQFIVSKPSPISTPPEVVIKTPHARSTLSPNTKFLPGLNLIPG